MQVTFLPDGKHVVMFPAATQPEQGTPRVAFILNYFDYLRRAASPAK